MFENIILLQKMLIDSKTEVRNLGINLTEMIENNGNDKVIKHLQKCYRACIEELLNVYEFLCFYALSHNLDLTNFSLSAHFDIITSKIANKFDTVFLPLYCDEIKNLVEHTDSDGKPTYSRLHLQDTNYTSIKKVYEIIIQLQQPTQPQPVATMQPNQ